MRCTWFRTTRLKKVNKLNLKKKMKTKCVISEEQKHNEIDMHYRKKTIRFGWVVFVVFFLVKERIKLKLERKMYKNSIPLFCCHSSASYFIVCSGASCNRWSSSAMSLYCTNRWNVERRMLAITINYGSRTR